MYLLVIHWSEDYALMMKKTDGERRDFSKENDVSDVSTEAKIKFYWLFNW